MRVALLVLSAVVGLAGCATPPGQIVFGSRDDPRTTFQLDERQEIGWTALLPAPVGGMTDATSVNLVISPSGSETELFGFRQFVTDPTATTLTNEMSIGRSSGNPART